MAARTIPATAPDDIEAAHEAVEPDSSVRGDSNRENKGRDMVDPSSDEGEQAPKLRPGVPRPLQYGDDRLVRLSKNTDGLELVREASSNVAPSSDGSDIDETARRGRIVAPKLATHHAVAAPLQGTCQSQTIKPNGAISAAPVFASASDGRDRDLSLVPTPVVSQVPQTLPRGADANVNVNAKLISAPVFGSPPGLSPTAVKPTEEVQPSAEKKGGFMKRMFSGERDRDKDKKDGSSVAIRKDGGKAAGVNGDVAVADRSGLPSTGPSSRASTPPGSPTSDRVESHGLTAAVKGMNLQAPRDPNQPADVSPRPQQRTDLNTDKSPSSSLPPSRQVSLSRKENEKGVRASNETVAAVAEGKEKKAAMADTGTYKPLTNAALRDHQAKSEKKERGKDGKGGGLMDMLLSSTPKLSRKGSNTSRGGRSDGGGSEKSYGGGGGDAHSTTSLLKKYGVCEKAAIGKGATAVVKLAHKWDKSSEKLYAVKEFRRRRKNETEKEYVKKLTSEFCISSTLHHVNVVETVDLVQDENHHWCEVMEYCPGGDLYGAIKRGAMSQVEVECCFKQVLNGIVYLHSMGVAHRDIKPENLLLDGMGHVKITDFGTSDVFRMCWEKSTHFSKGLCGSEPYIAPELFEHREYDARLVDVWSAAIVFYCMQFQELPWRSARQSDATFSAYVAAYDASPYPPPISNLSPKSCRSIIKRMLDPDPKTRATTDEIIRNPWIESIEVCEDGKPCLHAHVGAVLQNGA